MESPLAIVAIALFLALTTIILLLLVWHSITDRRERRRRRYWAEYHDSVLEFVVEGGDDAEWHLANAQPGRERSSVGALVSEYARVLRGEQRTRIAAFLQENGYVDDEIRLLRSSGRDWRRIWAAQQLGDFGAPIAVRDLSMAMLTDSQSEVRVAAARALGHIDDYKSAAALLTVLPMDLVPRGVVAQALLNLGGRAFGQLVDACNDTEPGVRYYACQLIALIGSGASGDQGALATQALSHVALHDPVERNRAMACRALAEFGDASLAESLESLLADDSWRVRGSAALTIGELGILESAAHLRSLLTSDPTAAVRRAAAYSMVALDPDIVSDVPLIAEARFSPIEGFSDVFV